MLDPFGSRRLWATLLVGCFLILSSRAGADAWFDDPLERTVGRFSFGSGRLLSELWSADGLAGPESAVDGVPVGLQWRPLPERLSPLTTRRPLSESLKGSVRQVSLPPGKKLLALTFDLCQTQEGGSGYNAGVVNLLRLQGVRATFYAGGLWMRTHPGRALQLLADPLFEVGSHGWNHADPRSQSRGKFEEDLRLARAQYELIWEDLYSRAARAGVEEEMALVPRSPLTFRFPYGACSRSQLGSLAFMGLPAIQWSVVPGDPDPRRQAALLADSIMEQIRPGAIVVLHANGRGRWTAEALGIVLPKLREAGYVFVTVSELLAAGEAVIEETCY